VVSNRFMESLFAIHTRETRESPRAAGIHSESENMVQLKPSSVAVAQPKPKYSHLSEIDPEFAQLREGTDKNFAVLWPLPMDEFKAAYLSAPVSCRRMHQCSPQAGRPAW
jgi:hypothetical protein